MHTLPATYMPAFFRRAAQLDRRRSTRRRYVSRVSDLTRTQHGVVSIYLIK